MTQYLVRRRGPSRIYTEPNLEAQIATGNVKRCGRCMKQWEAGQVATVENGVEVCVRCVDGRTEEYKAEVEGREARYNARMMKKELLPQLSERDLRDRTVSFVRTLTDTIGTKIYESHPLPLTRTVASTLLLNGANFTATDTITASTGIAVNVGSRTSTQTTISLTADSTMTPGNNYSLIFNSVIYRNVFIVR